MNHVLYQLSYSALRGRDPKGPNPSPDRCLTMSPSGREVGGGCDWAMELHLLSPLSVVVTVNVGLDKLSNNVLNVTHDVSLE